jgi:hypothetical protein
VTTEGSNKRAEFLRSQTATIAEGLAFASGEEEVASRFRDLAMETYDALIAVGQPPLYAFSFHSGSDGRPPILSEELPLLSRDLLRRWQEWSHEYRAVMARQPRQALHEALCLISYSHDAASWPEDYEWKILNWIESGELTPLPFDDRIGIATPEFYDELRSLRRRAQGWLYCELRRDGSRAVVFIPEDQLATWRQEQEAKWAKWR